MRKDGIQQVGSRWGSRVESEQVLLLGTQCRRNQELVQPKDKDQGSRIRGLQDALYVCTEYRIVSLSCGEWSVAHRVYVKSQQVEIQ